MESNERQLIKILILAFGTSVVILRFITYFGLLHGLFFSILFIIFIIFLGYVVSYMMYKEDKRLLNAFKPYIIEHKRGFPSFIKTKDFERLDYVRFDTVYKNSKTCYFSFRVGKNNIKQEDINKEVSLLNNDLKDNPILAQVIISPLGFEEQIRVFFNIDFVLKNPDKTYNRLLNLKKALLKYLPKD